MNSPREGEPLPPLSSSSNTSPPAGSMHYNSSNINMRKVASARSTVSPPAVPTSSSHPPVKSVMKQISKVTHGGGSNNNQVKLYLLLFIFAFIGCYLYLEVFFPGTHFPETTTEEDGSNLSRASSITTPSVLSSQRQDNNNNNHNRKRGAGDKSYLPIAPVPGLLEGTKKCIFDRVSSAEVFYPAKDKKKQLGRTRLSSDDRMCRGQLVESEKQSAAGYGGGVDVSYNEDTFPLCVKLDLSGCFQTTTDAQSPPNAPLLTNLIRPLLQRRFTDLHVRLHTLDLSSNSLTDTDFAPTTFTEDFADDVDTLFMSLNNFTRIPRVLAKFSKMTRLSLKSNYISAVDPINELPADHRLTHLILTDNLISGFESTFCSSLAAPSDSGVTHVFSSLRKLMLAGNRITSFASVFRRGKGGGKKDDDVKCALDSLELLRLTRNSIEFFSEEDKMLLKSFARLSWFSLVGNPITDRSTPLRELGLIPAGELDCQGNTTRVVGQGTSGIVALCTMKSGMQVAVKFLKKQSSDGSAERERAILSFIPSHNLLLGPMGSYKFDSSKVELFPKGISIGSLQKDEQGFVEAVVFYKMHHPTLAVAPNIETVTDDRCVGCFLASGAKDRALAGHSIVNPTGKCLDQQNKAQSTTEKIAITDRLRLEALALMVGIDVGIALGVLHHGSKVLHGDVYLHNVFVDSYRGIKRSRDHRNLFEDSATEERPMTGDTSTWIPTLNKKAVILGDFGASFRVNDDEDLFDTLVQVEVRSFGVLVLDTLRILGLLDDHELHVLYESPDVELPSIASGFVVRGMVRCVHRSVRNPVGMRPSKGIPEMVRCLVNEVADKCFSDVPMEHLGPGGAAFFYYEDEY